MVKTKYLTSIRWALLIGCGDDDDGTINKISDLAAPLTECKSHFLA